MGIVTTTEIIATNGPDCIKKWLRRDIKRYVKLAKRCPECGRNIDMAIAHNCPQELHNDSA